MNRLARVGTLAALALLVLPVSPGAAQADGAASGTGAVDPASTTAPEAPVTEALAPTDAAVTSVVPSPGAAAATVPTAEPTTEEEAPPRIEARLGEGVRFRAGDMFGLQIRARMQLQGGFVVPTADAVDAGADPVVTTNFQARRVRLVLTGHVLTPKLQYYFQFGFSYRDQEADRLIPVRDAYMTWRPLRDLSLRWGQMKVPYGLQRVVSSSSLQMVDRSIVTAEFNLDRDVGVYAFSEDLGGLGGKLMYYAGVFGGRGRNRFEGADEAMFVARFQVNPFGSFDHLSEADLTRSASPRLSIGFGAAYHFNGVRSRGTHHTTYTFADFDMLHVGGDVHLKWHGLSLMGEVFYRTSDRPHVSREDPNAPGTTQNEYARRGVGWFAQAGYMVTDHLEFTGRYGQVVSTVDAIPGTTSTTAGARMGDERELGGGVNYYIFKHALKVQLDYFRLWSPEDASDDRHQVRLQTQVYF